MQISGHYTGFPEKTLVVILNHECARIFTAHDHDFLEEKSVRAPAIASPAGDDSLLALYTLVHKRMERALTKEGCSGFFVCVPEVHRPLFQQHTPAPLLKKISRLIPKNLSAMSEAPIIRIIFEG